MSPKQTGTRTTQSRRGVVKHRGSRSRSTTHTTRGRKSATTQRAAKNENDKTQTHIGRDYFRSTLPNKLGKKAATSTGEEKIKPSINNEVEQTSSLNCIITVKKPSIHRLTNQDIAQLDQLVTDAWPTDIEKTLIINEGVSNAERLLRQFDLSLEYGPCIGISRIQRWQRAIKLNLNPPDYLADLLDPSVAEWRLLRGVKEIANIDRDI
ncbi:DNA polymerase delta, subunit 4-domain-containing protein [Syncephalis fuscata]|nr:DNA polymerase delta, subunit 4-domain-containing protein [Syncephalis fuscata]